MVLKRFTFLFFLVAQALSAPTGCTESCTFYQRHHQVQTSHGHQDHADLTQVTSNLQNVDFSRPGNWTRHNEYGTDDGHGKVHEEQGQYVDNSKKIRYFKKNYTSSYSTNYGNNGGLSAAEQQNNYYTHDVRVPSSQQILDFQRAYNQRSESELSSQHYNRIQSQQREQSLRRTNTHSERLEDLGEYNGDSQVIQQGVSGFNSQHSQGRQSTDEPGSWSRVNSYKTDGGHGQVFEEEGQYVTGPKKVRFYKRNYTSSYKSTGEIPNSDSGTVGLHDIQRQIENLHRENGKDFHQVSATGNTASIIENAHVNTIGVSRNNYRHQNSHGSAFNNMEQHNTEQHITDTSDHVYEDLPDTNPIQGTYGTNRHSTYERHEAYMTSGQPVAQYVNPTSSYTNVHTGSSEYNRNRNAFNIGILDRHAVDNLHQIESSSEQHSRNVQHQISNDNIRQTMYNQNIPSHSIPSGHSTHYQEHWHSSSQTRGTSIPQYNTDSLHIDEQSAQYNRNHHGNQHNSYYSSQGQNGYNSNYRSAGSSTSGMLDLGQTVDTVDCAQDSLEQVHEPRHHRKYKRDVKYDQVSDTQQSEDLTQQNEDLTQQNEDLTQQTHERGHFRQHGRRKIDFGQHVQGPHHHRRPNHYYHDLEDFRQQETTGKLEFGQQTEHHYFERPRGHHSQDYTQQYQQNRDMTAEKNEPDDFTQQTSGNIEIERPLIPWEPTWERDITEKSEKSQFDQETQHPQHLWKPTHDYSQNEDLTQQTGDFDDFTQQTSGKLEFGQQSHSGGSTWNSDLTQNTGKLEFGQQTQNSQNPSKPTSTNGHMEDLTQQGEDLTQQTGDFDDFTQQTSGNLEFGQQSQSAGPTWNSDFTQNTGKLEFGRQTQHSQSSSKPTSTNAHVEDLTEQGEDLTQQTGDFDDFTQQTSGKLEFGQQSVPSGSTWNNDIGQKPRKPGFGQQTEDLQSSWKPTNNNAHMEDFSQHGEDLTQQTGEFDDFTQQTSGKLEFGQQSPSSGFIPQQIGLGHESENLYKPQRPYSSNQDMEDLTQQTGSKFEFGSEYNQQENRNDHIEQHGSGNYLPKPAEKPKRRPMYRQPTGQLYNRHEIDKTVQMQNEKQNSYNQENSHLDSGFGTTTNIHAPPAKPDEESDTDNIRRGDQGIRNSGKDISKDLNQQTNINIFDIDRENVDQLNQLHKSNDATVGLQWHYTYHPSDLTNSEPVQNSFYPSLNYNSGVQQKEGQLTQQSNQRENEDLQQKSRPYNFDHQQTQNADRFEDMNQKSSYIESMNQQSANAPPSHSQHNFDQESQISEDQSQDYAFGQPIKPIQQTDNTRTQGQLEFGHQTKNHRVQNHDNKPLFKPEPRILEAYGGGPYDGTNTDDIYSKVTINPSATLPPTNVDDSWDIREKPIEVIGLDAEFTDAIEPTEVTETTTEAIAPPSFWGRIGNKITNTFDKVKEKARGVFG